ncbi:MAG: response regulator transcription factor [Amaricoccus sp.]
MKLPFHSRLDYSPRTGQPAEVLIIVDARPLERECFVRSLLLARPRLAVESYGSGEELHAAADRAERPMAILFNAGARSPSDPAVRQEIADIAVAAAPDPVIVLAQSEEVEAMVAALDAGARGYVPASVGIDMVYEASRLASVGGIFVPTASALSLRGGFHPRPAPAEALPGRFTPRQAAVAVALRCGKANKIIAYELNMRESTVKIHVRSILKKLGATNRTEAAFKLNALHGPA